MTSLPFMISVLVAYLVRNTSLRITRKLIVRLTILCKRKSQKYYGLIERELAGAMFDILFDFKKLTLIN